jgi:tRNA/rRNA methyltransferase
MSLKNVCVVLVEPQGALNIGSVCRVMMNFGFSDLRLVNPQVDHLGDEARRMAVKAGSLLEGAGLYPDLAAALADCHLAYGTTRRFGRYREDFVHPDEAGDELLPVADSQRVALVFGREDSGLLTAELSFCQRFLTIPTHEDLPSMNLAQAVSVCLYEVSRAQGRRLGKRAGRRKLASGDLLEGLFGHMRRSMLAIGFLDPNNPEHILRTFRRIFSRAGLNERDVKILHGLCRQLDWVDGQRRKGLPKTAGDDVAAAPTVERTAAS